MKAPLASEAFDRGFGTARGLLVKRNTPTTAADEIDRQTPPEMDAIDAND
jgi:hypothetical protein